MNPADKIFIKRKRYFIKKSFQTKFFIGFVLLLAAQALLIAGLFLHMSGQTLTTGYSGSQFVIERTSSFFFISFIIMSLAIGAAIAIAGAFIFTFVTHRIAGPVYRLEKTLAGLSEGNLASRVKLRKTDQLVELQDALNRALDRMDGILKEIKKDLDEAHDLTLRNDKERHIEELKEAIARAKQKTSFFKTT